MSVNYIHCACHTGITTETDMPLIEMPFRPYFDRDFNVQVDTEEEFNVCELFRTATAEDVRSQIEYLNGLARSNPPITSDKFFIFTSTVIFAKKKMLEDAAANDAKPTIMSRLSRLFQRKQEPTRTESVGVSGLGLLTSLIDNIVVDQAAYANMSGEGLPSSQYMRSRTDAILTWDMLNSRR